MTEEWRAIPGIEGYEVSDAGRVRSVNLAPKTGRILKLMLDADGYALFGYRDKRKGQNARRVVHRAVCRAFLGEPAVGQVCAHNNGICSDNRLENLRWATPSENEADKVGHGTRPWGSKHYKSAVDELTVAEIKFELARARRLPSGRLGRGEGIRIGEMFNVPRGFVTALNSACAGWKHVAPAAHSEKSIKEQTNV